MITGILFERMVTGPALNTHDVFRLAYVGYGETGSAKETRMCIEPELIYVLKGNTQIAVADKIFSADEKDYVVVNANTRCALLNESGDLMYARFVINYSFLHNYANDSRLIFICNTTVDGGRDYDSLKKLLDSIILLSFSNVRENALKMYGLCFEAVYVLLSKFLIKTNDMNSASETERLNEIQNYIYLNYDKKLSLSELAKQLYLSEAYLSKYFKRYIGMNFKNYLDNVRVFHALDDLLYTKKQITRIASDNGFSSTSSFNAIFKKYFGSTPTEYKNSVASSKKESEKYGDKLNLSGIKEIQAVLGSGDESVITCAKTVYVDSAAPNHPKLNRNWGVMINLGDAEMLSQAPVMEHIKILAGELKFSHIRIWNIWSLLGENPNGSGFLNMNFSRLDRILDFLISMKLYPFIDLSFKPTNIVKDAEEIVTTFIRKELFFSEESYEKAVRELAAHLVKRYGTESLEKWYFEFWHSPRVKIESRDGWYYDLFDVAYRALKKYSSKIKIGGAGIVFGYEKPFLKTVIDIWRHRNIWPDFFSVYSYGYTTVEQNGTVYFRKSSDADYIANQTKELKEIMKAANFDIKELYITEWGQTHSNRSILNDSCWKAAYLIKNCVSLEDEVNILGYYQATDLASEYYDTDAALNGDSGLLSKDGIRKPVFYAFKFLSKLKPILLSKFENGIVTTDGQQNYTVVCHNYKYLAYSFITTPEHQLDIDAKQSYLLDSEDARLEFRIKNVPDGEYDVRTQIINSNFGSVQDLWKKLHYARDLTDDEIVYMGRMSAPSLERSSQASAGGELLIRANLAPNEIRLIEITSSI